MMKIGQVLAAVQRRDRPVRHLVEDRKVKLVDVEMQDVELDAMLRTLSSISM